MLGCPSTRYYDALDGTCQRKSILFIVITKYLECNNLCNLCEGPYYHPCSECTSEGVLQDGYKCQEFCDYGLYNNSGICQGIYIYKVPPRMRLQMY